MLHFTFASLALLSFFYRAYAQDLSIPTGWRKPTSDLPVDDRIALTRSLINALTPQFNNTIGQINALTYDQNADVLSAIALFDRLTSNGDPANQLFISSQFQWDNPETAYPETLYPLSWGLSAISAYRTYGNPYFLNVAQTLWNQSVNYMITSDDVLDSGRRFGVNIIHQCNNVPVVGAVLYYMNQVVLYDWAAVGALLSLSARIYEVTGDKHYSAVADLTSQFILNFIGHDPGVDELYTLTCDLSADSAVPVQLGYALAIEGLSVYATNTRNETLTQHLQKMVLNVINMWKSDDGIYDPFTGGAYNENIPRAYVGGPLIRALFETWSRLPADSDLARLLSSYMTVQFNAVIDFARMEDRTNYSPSWHAPTPSGNTTLPWGQLQALIVFNAAVGMALSPNQTHNSTVPDSSSSDALPLQTSSGAAIPQPSHQGNLSTGIIAGIAVGAAVMIALLVALLLFVVCRRSKRKTTRSEPTIESLEIAAPSEQRTTDSIPGHLPASIAHQLRSAPFGSPELIPVSEKGGNIFLAYSTSSRYNPTEYTTSVEALHSEGSRDLTRYYAEEPPQYEPPHDSRASGS